MQSCPVSATIQPLHRRSAGTVAAIFCLGLSHHTAPIAVREKVAFSPENLVAAYRYLLEQGLARETLIVSTCNRTEIYVHGGQGYHRQALQDWLCHFHGVDPRLLDGHIYYSSDAETVRHLFRVACGLDSMIIGEPQILGQVKDAYQAAADSGAAGPVLNRLLHWAFRVAKRVRSETAIGSAPVSVAYAAVSLAKQLLGSLEGKSVLLIGAGDTIELVATHLREHGVGSFAVANRSAERGQQLAEKFTGNAHALEAIPELLHDADVVVSCTASLLPILTLETVSAAMLRRAQRDLMLVDLAVPRDIASEVEGVEQCFLYTLDDLNDIAQAGMRARREAAAVAELIIADEVAEFQQWRESLDVVPAIRRLRDHVEERRQEELQRFTHYLNQGQDPFAVLDAFSKALMNKVLHDPIATLRQPCQDATNESLVAALDILFHLSDAEG
ncbi:MAG: glutamyl-tRNA reductase [Acidithiobacillus ferriphilus]|uniref:Glutamyl-tRNA reductase n=3 Tax=Acidithiobacillus TaxID=119977 RepID=A0A179BI92_ACIFR|nr:MULTISPECIES: glutamyl-tRNA reductase [Acidithiobacillus]OYV82876.1 MAG: glutamyl-tRNA reductase [Acidithiobacillus ferrivorans]MBU2784828.1 glutamyl-tRNA reductase [Acidithiobacillus ferriphilus]MBU2834153.1 glutamyl-tRNA reductase [Acidithiobacillus ferriphilus]MBU2844530.1 glutamyl-tRNA reductase [Acidithiobacillus ferriphilus]MBU2848582.1 glutamyl-tRNA reductase [Acidithiobacillus ferriphilus]